jgi:hypothetical protein
MGHKNCDLMIGYWDSLRRGYTAPAQADIEPRAISRVLPNVFILDAASPTNPTYRLAGTAVCRRFGHDLRDKSYLDYWDGPSRETLRLLLRRALRVHRPVSLYSTDCRLDAGMVELETVLAPISIHNGEPTRFLGMAQVLNEHAQLTVSNGGFQSLSASHLMCEAELSSASN